LDLRWKCLGKEMAVGTAIAEVASRKRHVRGFIREVRGGEL
jgi:hypothetical protein